MIDKDGNDIYIHNVTTAKSETDYLEKRGVWKCRHYSVSTRSKTFEMKDFESRTIDVTYFGEDYNETFSNLMLHVSMILKSMNNDVFSLKEDIKVNVDNTNNQDPETTPEA